MAVKATFNVDFESFRSEVDKAIVSFGRFEGESDKVAKQLSTMADQFTGTKVIAEATLMAKAIESIGGASKLTDAELVRVSRTALDAADKFAAMGQEIPTEIQGLIDYADAAVKAAETNKQLRDTMDQFGVQTVKLQGSTSSLHKSLGEFNSLLAAGGINAAKEIGALGELGNYAGKTAAQLGTLATIGGTVGAAMAGWNIGRKIAEFTGSDKIIGDATAALLNWGNVAGEVAAAHADVLARATKNAGYSITDLTEAMKINADHAAAEIKHWKDLAAAEVEATKARNAFNDAQQKWHTEYTAMVAEQAAAEKKLHDEYLKQAAFVEQSVLPHPGLFGLSAAEQARTQAGFVQAAKLPGSAAAAVDTTNPFAVYTDEIKKATDALRENNALATEDFQRKQNQITQDRAIEAATKGFTDSMLKAAAANDAWVFSLKPMTSSEITPWSNLAPKAIQVRPIVPGSFGGVGAPNVTVNISGVFDPAAKDAIADVVGDVWMRRAGRR